LPTPSEQRVLDQLDIVQGNVQVVAQDLGVSPSWVNRIKVGLWRPKDTALQVAEPDPDPQEHLNELLPTNYSEVAALRDDVIAELRRLIKGRVLEGKVLVAASNVLLKYEREVHKIAAPAIGVFNDNRQVHFNTLVDKLGEMPAGSLRALSGVPEPLVIEAKTEEE
jgi:hypothetical protein